MKALVVYESMYGNTEQVARAIGAGLADEGIATAVHPVGRVEPAHVPGVDLLVVGGPTHVHGMTRPSTRAQARKDGKNTYEEPTDDPGLRGWMDDLPSGQGHLAAAFDTRIDGPKAFTGSAAKAIAHRLHRLGYEPGGEPGSFLVTKENMLVEGELVRARQWAREIAARASVTL